MTPSERLKEIETAHHTYPYDNGVFKDDIGWLISRVKCLTEALEKISNPDMSSIEGMIIVDMGLKHFVEHTARKALEEE